MDVRVPEGAGGRSAGYESAGYELDVMYAGSLFCDLVFAGLPELPQPGSEVYADRFAVTPGGNATRCVASARLGLRTALAATIGTDMFGTELVRTLSAIDNLDLRWLHRDPAVHTPITVSVTNEVDRSFITYQHEGTVPDGGWRGPVPSVRACHVGVAGPLPEWATTLRSRGTLLVGGVGWDPTGEWSPEVLDRLAEVDVFCPNAVEAMHYTRTDDPVAAARALADRVPLVVVTRGSAGALAIDSSTGECAEVPAVAVPVVDPTGAGDVFVSSFILGMLRGWPLADRLRLACVCAGLSVGILGGARGAPGWTQIRDFVSALPDEQRTAHRLILEEAAAVHTDSVPVRCGPHSPAGSADPWHLWRDPR